MLELRRKEGDCIIIRAENGDTITIKTLEGITKLGIDAPDTYNIVRGELIIDLYEIQQTTCISREEAQDYKDLLDNFQTMTGCSNAELKRCHKDILDYMRRRPGNSIQSVAYLCLARASQKGMLIQR